MERGSHTQEEESAHGYAGMILLALVFSGTWLNDNSTLPWWQVRAPFT